MPLNEADSKIVSRAKERARLRHGLKPIQQYVWNWAKRNFRTGNLVQRLWLANINEPVVPAPQEQTVQSLQALKDLGVSIEVVLVTQKNEVGIFTRSPDAELAESLLDKMQIRYRWCNLSPQHFMPIDSHPNSEGYDVLIECLTPLFD